MIRSACFYYRPYERGGETDKCVASNANLRDLVILVSLSATNICEFVGVIFFVEVGSSIQLTGAF
jgi:hypothetical protein